MKTTNKDKRQDWEYIVPAIAFVLLIILFATRH